MNRKLTLVATVAAAAAIATAAMAAVIFDSNTGTGFVGKGDVQLAFGWNNAQLQNNAEAVSFKYQKQTSYDITCEWETVTGGKNSKIIPHAVDLTKNAVVNGAVNGSPRIGKTQFTGYNLSGFSSLVVTGGAIPNVGDSCPMADASAVVTAVSASPTNQPGTLSAVWGAQSVVIYTELAL